jgi:uncharacterized ion transporter superfamily protein YfcC
MQVDPTSPRASRPPRLALPTPYTIIMIVIVLAAIATWVLPAGVYDRLSYDADRSALVVAAPEGERVIPASDTTVRALGLSIPLEKFTGGEIRRPVAVPGTYRRIESEAQGPVGVFQAPIRGIHEAIDVILFVLVIGGFVGVFNASGAFGAGIAALARRLRGREAVLVIVVTSLLALGGTTYGMAEETLAFYPILVPVFLAAGYDAMVPLAVIFAGSGVGFMTSTTNPFAPIIASDAAGIDWTVGLSGRVVMFVIATTLTIVYILRYARRVRLDPTKSLVTGTAPPSLPALPSDADTRPLTGKVRVLLSLFGLTFVVMIAGVVMLDWWFVEMTTLFFVAAIVAGLIHGFREKELVRTFLAGAEALLGVSFLIGMARGVTVVLEQGRISDTLLFSAARTVEGMPAPAFILALLLVFAGLAVVISSSSGIAVLTMPIMGSLALMIGVPTHQVVNAYMFGAGLTFLVSPTGLILPSLALVGVGYGAWLRFVGPLLAMLALVLGASLVIGVAV